MAESRAWTHWNRYETDGDIGDLAGAIAAMAAGERGPDALTFVLEHVDRLVAGEQVSLDLVEEADREYWAGLFFSVAGVFDQVPDALEQAIAAMSASLDLLDTVGATVLLGRYLTMRGTPEDLRAGLALLRAGMERTTADEPTLGPLHMFICGALAHLYELEDTPAIGIELAEALTAALAELPGEDLTATIELARYVAGRHLSNGRDLAEELAMRRLLVAVNPPGSPDRPIALYMLATNLAVRAMSARAPADTEEAIALLREAVALPEGPLPQALIRSFLSMCLSQLQEMTGIRGLHDEAVALAREGLAQAPPELHDYCLENFGTALTGRYMENHDVADLDEIITKLGGLDTAGVVRGISLVCAAYYDRFLVTGAREDLEEAVARGRRVLELLPADLDVGFADMLGNVANALRLRSALTGDGADLDEAIGLYRRAVEITPAENADRAKVCGNLSAALSERFLRTDSEADLTDALGAAREALSAAIPGSAAYHLAETSYARVMADRFLRTGNRADLDEAIIRFRRVAAESDDPAEINALGAALQRRYDLIGSIADLQGAIAAFDAVLAATAPLSSQHTTTSGNLGNALASRYRLTGDRADIDRAVEALRHAQAHAEVTSLSMVHINLAKALSFRYESLGENADLDTAVEEARLAYETLPPGSSRRRAYRAGWAAQLLHRTSRGRGEDLDQAIEILTDIVGPAAGSGPEDGIFLFNLAEALLTRNTGDDRTKAVAALRTATQMETCAAEIRVRSARRWASTAYADGDTGAALDALRAAVQLLPLLAWRGISRSDQERGLADLTGLAGEAAALALIEGQPELAVELLEHGRAVLWAQLLETRTDLTALAEADPALAARLTEVRAALDADLTGEPGQVTLDRTALAGEWDELVQRVRGLPGFEGFLHPPEFMELARAADEGPVVILNVTALRCDALIVRERTVTVAALPDVTAAEVAEWANTAVTLFAQPSFGLAGAVALHRGTEELLRWLGTRIAGPVLDAVGTAPRLWWCPTGPLGVLPLHAAIDAAGVCALDRTISSYTPTLRMLIEARARPEDDPRHRRALVIAMDSTPGAPNLNVQPEIDLVRNLFGTRCTVLSQPSVDEVRRELPGHLWIHFACHGLQDPDQPSRNGVALSDGVLTVLDIAALSSQAELAFLSACRTASVGAVLTDEAIHLASALHATGFRHVIATLWPVFDATAPLMARRIYEQLPNVAFAVNAAARNLRAEDRTALPALWAPYVHIGP